MKVLVIQVKLMPKYCCCCHFKNSQCFLSMNFSSTRVGGLENAVEDVKENALLSSSSLSCVYLYPSSFPLLFLSASLLLSLLRFPPFSSPCHLARLAFHGHPPPIFLCMRSHSTASISRPLLSSSLALLASLPPATLPPHCCFSPCH